MPVAYEWTPGDNVTPPPAWSLHPTIGRMVTGRRNHTATMMPDGYVLICGGFVQGTATTAKAELFDPPAELFVREIVVTSGHLVS